MFTWEIERLDCMSDHNLVYTVHYCVLYADDGSADSKRTVARGTVGLNVDNSSGYVPYEELTKDLVLQWVFETLGGEKKVSELEQSFLQHAGSLKTTLQKSLPW